MCMKQWKFGKEVVSRYPFTLNDIPPTSVNFSNRSGITSSDENRQPFSSAIEKPWTRVLINLSVK